MIIDLKNLFNNEGESIALNHTADFSGFELNGGYPFKTPVKITGALRNRAGIVSMSAKAEFTYEAQCDRCASEVKREFCIPVEHFLAASLNNEEDDGYLLVEDMTLDVDDLILTDILLSFPMKFLCSESCKGLCVRCGKNLNEGPCGCQKPVDPRLEVLRQLLDS